MTQARKYMSLADAAEYLGCNQRTIRRWIGAGRLTGYRVGKIIRVNRHELDDIMRPIPTVHRVGVVPR